MIANTFCHLPKFGPKKELSLWQKGIYTWDDFTAQQKNNDPLADSRTYLNNREPSFFGKGLEPSQMWRLFGEFRDDVAYFDIETTGLERHSDHITTIALYDGKNIKTYIHGQNLDQFKTDIFDYKVLVSFNGRVFDAPFIQNYFNITLNHAHIDLRPIMRILGFTGGLKIIEKQFGIDRKELTDVDGYFAVRLWQEYKRKKNQSALETLLAYNVADVVNLELLMVQAYNMCLQQTPFSEQYQLPLPKSVAIPFQVNQELIRRMRQF